MIKLEINHKKFNEKLGQDPKMKEWYDRTRFVRAAYMHCKRWKNCPLNPFIEGKPNHKHDWDILDRTVIAHVTKKVTNEPKAGK